MFLSVGVNSDVRHVRYTVLNWECNVYQPLQA